MNASRTSADPHSRDLLPNSRRIYAIGTLFPDVRVPFREVRLTPTRSLKGQVEENGALRLYDTSGTWGDEQFDGAVERGLPAVRQRWISDRGEIEPVARSYRPVPGRSDATIPPKLQRQA